MNYSIVAEYIKKEGILAPDAKVIDCENSIFIEDGEYYISIFIPSGEYLVIYMGYNHNGKRTSVCNTYPPTEDPYLVVDYLREDVDDMIQRLDRRLERLYGPYFN